jgi:hypothetical protein
MYKYKGILITDTLYLSNGLDTSGANTLLVTNSVITKKKIGDIYIIAFNYSLFFNSNMSKKPLPYIFNGMSTSIYSDDVGNYLNVLYEYIDRKLSDNNVNHSFVNV